MSFLIDNFSTVGSNSRKGESPQTFAYKSANDTMAQITASGYFDELSYQVVPDDTIFVRASDSASHVIITAAVPNGTVTSEVIEGSGEGTVTSVATGQGLTGGPITGSGTISIPNAGIDTIMISDNAITTDEIAGDAVTFPKMQNIGGEIFLGRTGASGGAIQQISVEDARTLLGVNFRGALVYRTAVLSIPTGMSNGIVVPWTSENYDTDSIHDNSTNPSRLTVPSGVTRVRLRASGAWAQDEVGDRRIRTFKNGAVFIGQGNSLVHPADDGTENTIQSCESAVVTVVGGDYFELQASQDSAGALDLVHDSGHSTWFAMEIIE